MLKQHWFNGTKVTKSTHGKQARGLRPFFVDQESKEVTMYFNPSTISRIEILGEEEGEKSRHFDVFRVHFTDSTHIDITEDIDEFFKRCN